MWPNLLNMFKGKAGGAKMTPYKDLKAEELAAWEGYDPDSEKSRATQYANAVAAQQQSPQQSAMFGQFGDLKKDMGSIWSQLKGGISNIDKKMEENYAASGWAPKGYKSPYDKSSSPLEDRKKEGYFMPGADEKYSIDATEQDVLANSMVNGVLDVDKYKEEKAKANRVKDNPMYQEDLKNVNEQNFNEGQFMFGTTPGSNPLMQLGGNFMQALRGGPSWWKKHKD